jgi:hypothetical protein
MRDIIQQSAAADKSAFGKSNRRFWILQEYAVKQKKPPSTGGFINR